MIRLGVLGGRSAAAIDASGAIRLGSGPPAAPGRGREHVAWWVGAGESWHRPAEEVAVRQTRRRGTPVVDTAWRVAGGDVRTESYAVVLGGREWIVVEVHNDTRVPLTLALVLERTDGGPAAWTLEGTAVRRQGADQPALVSSRPVDACCDAEDLDALLERLRAGDTALFDPAAGLEAVRAVGERRCAAVVFALTHGGSLRVLLCPSDDAGGGSGSGGSATALPAAPTAGEVLRAPGGEAVARGWVQQLGVACRFDLGDDAAEADATRRRAELLLGATGAASVPDEVEAVLDATALAWFAHPVEALARLDAALRSLRPPVEAELARRVLVALADVVRCSPDAPAVARLLLPGALDLAAWASPGRGEDPVARWALHELAVRAGERAEAGRSTAAAFAAGGPAAVRRSAPDSTDGYGLVVQRGVLVEDDEPGVVAVLAGWRPAWRGRPVDVHGLPTAAGTLSYAIRWHGARPALLWQLDRTAGAPAEVTLRAPALDPGFSSTSRSGEALLAEPAAPAGPA